MQCNIDSRGKSVRLIWGLVMLLTAGVIVTLILTDVLTSAWWWGAAGFFALFGVLGVYEARAGWCVVRALGIKTRV